MQNRELYQQKLQAQLSEWKADIDKLKAQASGASADAQLDINKQIEILEGKIEEGRAKLSALALAGSDTWESMAADMDMQGSSIKSTFQDVASKFKE